MKRVLIGSSLIVSSIVFLAGCGSSSGGGTVGTPQTPVRGTAFYVDSAVEGATVVCGDTTTVTDAQGSFAYEEGSTCRFTYAGVQLREQANITEGAVILEDSLPVAQFLQSLDNDNDANNGIQLTAQTEAALRSHGVVAVPNNDTELAGVVEQLHQTDQGYHGEFVSKEEAQYHMDDTRLKHSGAAEHSPQEGAGPNYTPQGDPAEHSPQEGVGPNYTPQGDPAEHSPQEGAGPNYTPQGNPAEHSPQEGAGRR